MIKAFKCSLYEYFSSHCFFVLANNEEEAKKSFLEKYNFLEKSDEEPKIIVKEVSLDEIKLKDLTVGDLIKIFQSNEYYG